MDKASLTKNTHLQATRSYPANQSLQESIFSPIQEKLKNKSFPSLQKNKTSFQHTMQTLTDTALNVNRMRQIECKLDTSTLRTDRRASGNKVLPKAVVTDFYGTFVLNRTLVFKSTVVLKRPAFGNT